MFLIIPLFTLFSLFHLAPTIQAQTTIIGGDGVEVTLQSAPSTGLTGYWQYSELTEQDDETDDDTGKKKRWWQSTKVSIVEIPTYDKIPHVEMVDCPSGTEPVEMHYKIVTPEAKMPAMAWNSGRIFSDRI